jgi:hypothetical protein
MRALQGFFKPGELAERLNAAVLKTVSPQGLGGSNPSLSASYSFDLRMLVPEKRKADPGAEAPGRVDDRPDEHRHRREAGGDRLALGAKKRRARLSA